MIAQTLPTQAPYTLLDYGVSLAVLIVLGITLYLFWRYISSTSQEMVQVLRELTSTVHLMKEEFFAVEQALHRVREDVETNRELFEKAQRRRRQRPAAPRRGEDGV